MGFNMTYPYNMTALQNVSTVTQAIDYLNINVTGVWQLFIVVIFLIITLSLRRYGFESAITTASFICAIISWLLWSIQSLPMTYGICFLIMTAFGVLWLYLTPR